MLPPPPCAARIVERGSPRACEQATRAQAHARTARPRPALAACASGFRALGLGNPRPRPSLATPTTVPEPPPPLAPFPAPPPLPRRPAVPTFCSLALAEAHHPCRVPLLRSSNKSARKRGHFLLVVVHPN